MDGSRTGAFVTATMFASTKSAIAKLTLVFLLGSRSLLGRRVVGRWGRGGHFSRRCGQNDHGWILHSQSCDDIVPSVSSHRFWRRDDDRISD